MAANPQLTVIARRPQGRLGNPLTVTVYRGGCLGRFCPAMTLLGKRERREGKTPAHRHRKRSQAIPGITPASGLAGDPDGRLAVPAR